MARKLSSIEDCVHNRTVEFSQHLNHVLPHGVLRFVERLQSRTQVYLFSGIIRDFFLKKNYHLRDVDFIIEDELNVMDLFPQLKIVRNSFEGYKTKIDSLKIDLWRLDDTWGLKHGQLNFSFKRLDYLPNTTFFNFSSIVFSLNEKKFIVGQPFLRFLRDKVLDIVLEANPYPALCIVNSFYYSEKYNLRLSARLRKYIIDNYRTHEGSFNQMQKNHFNKIVYPKKDLLRKISELT